MADAAYDEKRIRDEAAGWYAKLNNTTISTETLRAFREWRNSDRRCAEAYQEIDAFWRRAAKIEHDPEIQRAIGEALAREKKGLSRLPRIGPRGVAGAVLALALGLGAIAAWPVVVGRAYQTEIGEQRFVRLADGSRVRLDTDSRIRVKLNAGQRAIELVSGRAFFDVAHDQSRPFIVTSGPDSVRALGTRFSVERAAGGAEVTLVEGKVLVESDRANTPRTWTLSPGQHVKTAGGAPGVQDIDPLAATSWTRGQLTFSRRTLAEAAAEVNRYSRRKVVLDDPALASRQISGVFDAGDTDAFVAAVSELYGVEADQQGDDIRLRPSA